MTQHQETMRSQEPTDLFTTPIRVDSTDSEGTRCYPKPSYMMYNRDTYQMSPLLFESDTDDTSQSTEIKCYQKPADAAPQPSADRRQTLSDFRNELTSQLETSSQHNQCCSETLLSSSHHRTTIETNANTHSAYISPSPRVTRSKLWRSRILTRSAKRLHKISELSEYSPGLRNCRKAKIKTDLRKELRISSDGKGTTCKASDKKQDEEKLIESIRKSNVSVVLERLKFPFFQNPHQVLGKFVQPNIVPNIVVDIDEDDGLEFLNRRASSEVQVITERPAIISISSESSVRNMSPTPRASPDLFENFDSLCSQNSLDIPNGQIALRSSAETLFSNSATSTPNNQQESTLVPSIFDLFDQDRVTPDVNTARQKFIETSKVTGAVPQPTFEITVNEVFDNVIYLTDSEETLTPQIVNRAEPPIAGDNLMNVAKLSTSQEVTPKKRPEIRGLLNRSLGANSSTSLNRSKWLSKPRSSDGGDNSSRTPQLCRRLDRSFYNARDNKPNRRGYVDSRNRFTNILLTSSEDDDS